MIRLFLVGFLTTLWLGAMPAFVNDAIRKSGIPAKDISLWIRTVSGHTVAALHPDKLRKPASVVKLFTAYAALRKFGFDYRFPTRFFIDGTLSNGVVYGNLYVKGYGDPTLGEDDLPSIVAALRQRGIRTIKGNIVIDRTYFAVPKSNSAHFDEHPYSPYNAMPDALMFNERVSTVCIDPKARTVRKSIPDKSYTLHNALRFVNRACKGRYAWPRVKIEEGNARTRVIVKGKLSTRCGERKMCQVVTQPYKSFYYAFREALRRQGISVQGRLRTAKVPHRAKPIHTHYSKRLETIVAKTLKKSNNLYARHLFLAVGARMFGAPATLTKARRAVMLTLQNDGVATQGLVIDNGCGLSRRSRADTRHLMHLLHQAYRRYGSRWMSLLAIGGVDGTIKRRFRGSVAAKRMWMKTGTLKHAKNIAGYVKARNGTLYEVVILINTRKPRYKAARLEDRIIEGLVRFKGYREHTVAKPPRLDSSTATRDNHGYFIQVGTFLDCPKPSFGGDLRATGLSVAYRRENGACKVTVGPFASESQAREVLPRIKRKYPGAFLVGR